MNSDYILRKQDEVRKFYDELNDDVKYSILGNLTKNEYLNKVFLFINKMRQGQSIEIAKKVQPENTEIFIKCVCVYILETDIYDIEFSNDFLKIKKI